MTTWVRIAQDGFLAWVLLGVWWGYAAPEAGAAGKTWIPEALGAIMLGMGLTLTGQDLKGLLTAGKPLIVGATLQYLVMPLGAWMVARALDLPELLAVGLILVGACPGGTASNVITFLARGDVALSVGMTTMSTLLSPLMTPIWVWLLASTWLVIDPLPLFLATTKIVLLPLMLGVVIRKLWTPGAWFIEGALPLGSMLIVAWIVGVIVSLNHERFSSVGIVFAAVAIHNATGLLLGYAGAARANIAEQRRRTVSLEVGMQNSGLAVALSIAHFEPAASIPAAIFSVWHNVTGPLLAAYWRRRLPRPRDSGSILS